jgi:hypothetical protein
VKGITADSEQSLRSTSIYIARRCRIRRYVWVFVWCEAYTNEQQVYKIPGPPVYTGN